MVGLRQRGKRFPRTKKSCSLIVAMLTNLKGNEMKKEILDCISKGGVSFVELCRDVPGFKGEQQIRIPSKNWIIWAGLSQEAYDAIKDLIDDKLIEQKVCDPMIYICDGGWVNLPLVKSNRAYKKPRWLPVVYSLAK